MYRPTVYSIPIGAPFLPTLVDAFLGGDFGAIDPGDPLSMTDATVLLPTRRAARAFRQLLLERSTSRSVLMPSIRPIGDIDEDEHLLVPPSEDGGDPLSLPLAITGLERRLALSGLVLAWGDSVRLAENDADEQAIIPSSAADAFKLSGDLSRLIDDMETAGIGWETLRTLAPTEYAGYWQLTLEFLKIAGEQWPRFLTEIGRVDPAKRRDQLIRAHARRLAATSQKGPVIAAGSTGSIPATAELLKTIARLPNGAVILPGLDSSMDDTTWSAVSDDAEADSGSPSHPQFGMKRLLSAMGVDRRDVEKLGHASRLIDSRVAAVSEAMRPATTTDKWINSPTIGSDIFEEVIAIIAANEEEEALSIAIVLREAVEAPGRTAALVTPDRILARRVAVELRRWRIRIDDSAGEPLASTMPGVLARLLAEGALTGTAEIVAAVGKHPLARFHSSRLRCRRASEALEIALLRGPSSDGSIATLPKRLSDMRLATEMRTERFAPRARRRLSKFEWNSAEALAVRYAAALGPLEALSSRASINVSDATRLLTAAIEAAADDGTGNGGSVWSDPAGAALAELLGSLIDTERLSLPPREYPGFIAAAMAEIVIAPEQGVDPRIHIWGTLEARLQPVDLLILGGLDEGVWPSEARTDPWLSRQMRSAIGLPSPERRIGLAAHDFCAAMGTERVVICRAKRRGGTPTVESRWVQRLRALLGDRFGDLTARGERYLALARGLDAVPPIEVRPTSRPMPAPKVGARPTELSVTSIEQLIRDPYAVYARRILQLVPLDPIGQRADPRLRGSLIHEAFADFTRTWSGPFDVTARDRLVDLWRHHFEAIAAYPEVHAVWLLKADRIADWMIRWEASRDSDVASRHAEIAGVLEFDIGIRGKFRLTGRADRIDIMRDGRAAVFDYKTGALSTSKQVLLFQPQLPLEGAILGAGGFGRRFADKSIDELAWIGLGQVGKSDPVRSAVPDEMTADTVSAEAIRRVRELILAYEQPDKGYVSQARPMFERRIPGDYDHLARVAEWRFAPRGQA